jgi:hypothetical protein
VTEASRTRLTTARGRHWNLPYVFARESRRELVVGRTAGNRREARQELVERDADERLLNVEGRHDASLEIGVSDAGPLGELRTELNDELAPCLPRP